ncbi:tuberin isoform X1 [Maniola hyperantus]|uniref:tuberin isoform X1 n=1 Tax=Aphantopus hyperantus TaxID=2795564 RepID=UPI001567D3D3|nr:tuberin [Maniola hyperantus]
MGSRDREIKSLQEKLKVFFKKGATAPVAATSELVVSPELRRELGPESPLHRRLRAIKEVGEKVLQIRVQEGGVEKIWTCTRDLLEDPNPEARHAALGLLRCIAEGQPDLIIMRTILFQYLQRTHSTHPPEDYQLRFKLLYTLLNTGKDIKFLEEMIGPFLLDWLPQLRAPAHIVEFVNLIINIVKFNAAYLDEDIVHGIVNNACHLCVYSSDASVVQGCLSLLEAVVSYSILPRAALGTFVAALCRTVIIENYCQNSWKLMRCVVGADMGHAALQEMVELVRAAGEATSEDDESAGLARGAVFYINMALWGPRRVHTLHVSYLAVLPAFLKALTGRHLVVTYEVVVALESLVARVPMELHEVTWDLVLDIVRAVLQQDKTFDPPNELIHNRVHALITSIEQLHEAGQYRGDTEALLDLIDSCGHDRPEASTMRLISERLSALGGGDASAALRIAERYVRLESRLTVRLHALSTLLTYIKRHRCTHGEELSERVGGAVAGACALDADVSIRAAAARALPDLAKMCSSDACVDLIDQLEKILNRPFDMYVTEVSIPADADTSDLRLAATGLLDLLHDKLLRTPATHAARAFLVLLEHLDHHYRRPALLHHHPDIRLKILDMLFGLRANSLNCVGFCYENKQPVHGLAAARARPICSPFLLAEPPAPRGTQPATQKELPPGACPIPVGRAARTLTAALASEADWSVLAHILRALPPLLHARALAVGRRAQDLDLLASTLCSMVSDRNLCVPEPLRTGAPGRKLLVSELHAAALPALAALASYHAYLEPQTQQRIVRCLLKYGMVLRTPQPFINALTIFTLETRDTMVKMLPEVLLDLSKISDTKAIASPMLEFLSTLTRLPRVFASFVEDQYMSVFAILLPYTNPSRYNHYVVSLAHHVIAAWFLKCRLSYRRNFVRFIIHGLHNYIIMPFEEQQAFKSNNYQPGNSAVNEDSSNRQRSSSLGSRAVSRAPLSGSRGAPAAFHVELTETCVDLLARYTFTPCSVKPQRSDTAEFLFNGGQSTTWLVGHKLVTITTSGCLQNSIKQGLCERCATLCRQHAESAASPLPAPALPVFNDFVDTPAPTLQVNDSAEPAPAPSNHLQVHANHAPEVKRYSKYSLQHSRSTETSCSSLSISELQPPSSGHTTRQNSAENNKTTDPIIDALNQFTQRFEKISKEVEDDSAGWSRVGELTAAGSCPCWCARWAELHVRSPTGDVSWLLRMQNHMSSSQLQEWPLQDVLALLSPPLSADLSSGIGDSRPDLTSEGSPRMSRSASQRSHVPDLHKSSSDTVVGSDKKSLQSANAAACARLGTQPINIPGSPQRQSSSSTTDDDDMLLIVPEGKSRHPVRRSNSSPEMSSSWKGAVAREPSLQLHDCELTVDVDDLILLPSCEPTSAPMAMHASKKANKKSDMRVSCEAIPEEMCGTSPQPAHPHPHLMTYKSDPGTSGAESEEETHAETNNSTSTTAHHQLQKTSSDSRVVLQSHEHNASRTEKNDLGREELPPLARSKRSNTISVMSPTRRNRDIRNIASSSSGTGTSAATGGGGVSPSFVFLQLYHNMSTYPISPSVPGEAPAPPSALSERPLKVSGEHHERTIKNLDLVPPVETYKVGVLYVGPGQQDDEVAILKNEYGSVRYMDFLRLLGTLVPLEGAEEPNLFLNLEKGGKDGRYTYVWNDDIMQVLFHVATAMPSSARDPHCNEKRKYIGNDFVSIVYNDSGHDFNILTIKGHFNLCIVVVEPLEHGMNRVTLKTKDERLRGKFLAHVEPQCVSDSNVALLARQHALHAALASQISQSLKPGSEAYASNSLERLRIIKRLRARAEAERQTAASRAPAPYAAAPERHRRVAIDDFNDYT